MNNKIDIYAPIIPEEGLGYLKLATPLKEYYELIKSFSWFDNESFKDGSATLFSTFHVGYEMKDTLIMVFNVVSGKLQRICALKNYEGMLLGKLKVGMSIEEALNNEPRLKYDDFEEYYTIEGVNGVTIEPDAYGRFIEVITVYTEDLI